MFSVPRFDIAPVSAPDSFWRQLVRHVAGDIALQRQEVAGLSNILLSPDLVAGACVRPFPGSASDCHPAA